MAARVTSDEIIDRVSEDYDSSWRKHSNLKNALNFLTRMDSSTPVRNNIKLFLVVEEVVKHSMNQGLEPSQISTLLDVIANPHHKMSQGMRSKFVKCLIPSSKVPQDAIIRALSFISSKVFVSPGPSVLHSLLLRWIILVFDYIDGYDQLHLLYNVVFCLINSHRLIPYACHLLFLLTTKQDVRLYKVQKLLALVNSMGPEPYIMGVLMIYKMYCPHLVPMKLDLKHKVFFKVHDVIWRTTITETVRQRNEADSEALKTASEMQSRRDKAKLQPKMMIPEAHYAAHEVEEEADVDNQDLLQTSSNKIPYTQIESFTEFLEAIDRIEHPSQIAACLNDTKLQLLLASNPDPLIMVRLSFWIQHVFAFGFKDTDPGCVERNEKMLHMLYTFSKNVQSLPVVYGFLENFLSTWDGQNYAPLIFSLITCVKPSSYTELHSSILEPLKKIFFAFDVYTKTMCISALTKLMRNLALEEKSGSLFQTGRTSELDQPELRLESSRTSLCGEDGVDQQGSSNGEPGHEASTLDVLYRMILLLDVIIVIGMRMEDDHYLLQISSLELLQLVAEMYMKYNIPLICLPMRLIHRLLLSDCPATLSRICGIINIFRDAFVSLKSNTKKSHMLFISCATISNHQVVSAFKGTDTFNTLLLDVLGMFWQGRMFTDRKRKSDSLFSFRLPSHLEGKLKNNSLSIYMGPAFIGLAYRFLKETQREGKRVHPVQIEEVKEIYLQFLVRENFPEFMQLVNKNITCRKIRN